MHLGVGELTQSLAFLLAHERDFGWLWQWLCLLGVGEWIDCTGVFSRERESDAGANERGPCTWLRAGERGGEPINAVPLVFQAQERGARETAGGEMIGRKGDALDNTP